ncbi:hypothetical protein FC19_GL002187 [Liquorilactobacillus aquaticus DSM 21051]|uniref:Single-stranded DNA-binding protein n=1 Tax=Liquorilactobacillus aquaticus DSM 21051 TaxID=1423725 RepID=A0A0R2CUP4_9LACO|nr:single-stranded DNA-binding protein [Liquorilactobacillus aquaticus]KRM95093.1 hypothetical protein FC19_GL002187 [Liquorilactobacillus aquaticus DSM 21051]
MNSKLKSIFEVIDAQLDDIPNNQNFSLPELYGEKEWDKLYIGDRVMAGNMFRREVLQGHYINVSLLPKKDRKKRTQYLKH